MLLILLEKGLLLNFNFTLCPYIKYEQLVSHLQRQERQLYQSRNLQILKQSSRAYIERKKKNLPCAESKNKKKKCVMIDDNTLCLKPFFESTVSSSLQQIFNEVHWSVLEVLVCVDKEFMKEITIERFQRVLELVWQEGQ